MKLSKFSKTVGLTHQQIRRICANKEIPFNTTPGGHRDFTIESVEAIKKLLSPQTRHFYIGPPDYPVPKNAFPLLPLIKFKPDDSSSFIDKCIEILKKRYTQTLTINLEFHPHGAVIATGLCLYCLTHEIEFHGGGRV